MAEINQVEMLSALMGEQGKDAMQMLHRMERLKKLMGTPQHSVPAVQETTDLFARNRQENMLSAAIPFLDRGYQKEMYLLVRLMEMRRVLQEEMVGVREKQEEPLMLRRRKLLGAIQGYLSEGERQQMETLMKIMDVRTIMEQEGKV